MSPRKIPGAPRARSRVRGNISAKQVAELARATRTFRACGFTTIAEAAVFCEAAEQTDATISSIAETLAIAYTRVSRIVYGLEQGGWLRYESHSTDRRKKVIRANVSA